METVRKLLSIDFYTLLVVSIFMVAGCAESSDDEGEGSGNLTGNAGTACQPFAPLSCMCPGEVDGTQSCLPDGSGYGACKCPQTIDTDDTAGTSGTSGVGGTNGTSGAVGPSGMAGTGDSGVTSGAGSASDTGNTSGTGGTSDTGVTSGTGGTSDMGSTNDTGVTSGTGGMAGTGDAGSITAQVLLFIRSGSEDLEFMLKNEVIVMKDTLERSGFEVVIASLEGTDFSAGDITVKADIKLAEANVADYAGFILPCMMVPSYPEPEISEEALNLVNGFIAAGKPVAAQTGSLWTLAKAGVLKGKKYAYPFEERSTYFEGAIYAGTGVVKDDLVLTSGLCPHMARRLNTEDGTEQLSLALVEVMKDNM